jgi:hypothetical protein
MEKAKTVEVTLSKAHTHGGVLYSKDDIIEVPVSDVPILENFKVLQEGSIKPVGTKKAAEEAKALKERQEFDDRIAAAGRVADAAAAIPSVAKPVAAPSIGKENV